MSRKRFFFFIYLFFVRTNFIEKQEVGIEIIMDNPELNMIEEKKPLFEKEKESRLINEEKLKDADRPKKRFKLGK